MHPWIHRCIVYIKKNRIQGLCCILPFLHLSGFIAVVDEGVLLLDLVPPSSLGIGLLYKVYKSVIKKNEKHTHSNSYMHLAHYSLNYYTRVVTVRTCLKFWHLAFAILKCLSFLPSFILLFSFFVLLVSV